MNRLLPALALLTMAAASLAPLAVPIDAHAAPAPERATETRNIGAFSAIDVSGPFDVQVDGAAPRALQLSGPAGDLADIETFVERNTLVVRRKARNGWHFSFGKHEAPVVVTIGAPLLNSLKSSGSGNVRLDRARGETLQLAVTGPGDLEANGNVRELAVRGSGSGDIDLRGLRAAILRVKLSGPGDMEAAGVTQELAADVTGSGDLDVTDLHAQKVSTTLTGPGSVALHGRSRAIHATLAGSGDLDACGLAVESASTSLSGPGSACVAGAIGKLEAQVHGSGDLEVRGLQTPSLRVMLDGPGSMKLDGSTGMLEATVAGSGSIDGAALRAGRARVAVSGPGNAVVNVAGKVETFSRPEASRLVTIEREAR